MAGIGTVWIIVKRKTAVAGASGIDANHQRSKTGIGISVIVTDAVRKILITAVSVYRVIDLLTC